MAKIFHASWIYLKEKLDQSKTLLAAVNYVEFIILILMFCNLLIVIFWCSWRNQFYAIDMPTSYSIFARTQFLGTDDNGGKFTPCYIIGV